MKITFVGNELPPTERIVTGFRSLDRAMSGNGNLGYPIGTLAEIYGRAGIGKTTVMLALGGLIASRLGGNIAFADLEGQSYDTVANSLDMSGFSGNVDMLRDNDRTTHVEILDNMIEKFRTSEYNVSLLDSVGAFMPPGEMEGSVADANMGRKPFIIGNWTRAMVNIMISKRRSAVLYVTHQHSNIGFVGTHTSGGETKNFMSAIQIELRKKEDFETGWLVEGTVKKNRFGKKDQTFILFIIGGQGVHAGLTAVFECVNLGLAEIERKVVRMDGESYGKVSTLITNWKDESLFTPFHNALISAFPALSVEETTETDSEAPTEEVKTPVKAKRAYKRKSKK